MRVAIACLLFIVGCGLSATGNELTGQVKKVVRRTPIICPDYYEADVSLGIIRNGTGSMSKEDVQLYVASDRDAALLKRAAETGQLVKVTYDVQRVGICRPDHWLSSVALVEDRPSEAK